MSAYFAWGGLEISNGSLFQIVQKCRTVFFFLFFNLFPHMACLVKFDSFNGIFTSIVVFVCHWVLSDVRSIGICATPLSVQRIWLCCCSGKLDISVEMIQVKSYSVVKQNIIALNTASPPTLSMGLWQNISHSQALVTNFFPSPPIKLKLGLPVGGRLLGNINYCYHRTECIRHKLNYYFLKC
jgi:hypothetical protein